MEPNVDLIFNGEGQGDVASKLISQGRMDPGIFRPWVSGKDHKSYVTVYKGGDPNDKNSYAKVPYNYAATLRRDEWKSLDEAVLKISETRLNGVQDLISKGLVYNLGNGMGTTVFEWHDVSDALDADLTMDGVTRAQGDRPVFQHNYLPLPIIHADYEINTRVLAASRNLGNPLDTTMAERAGRKVAEKLENMLFTNTTYAWGTKDDRDRNTIYSYINHPDRNQVTLSDYGSWDDSAVSARLILNSVLKMKQTSIDDYHYGPWMLYIPMAYETVLDEDYEDTGTTSTGKTIRERILAISGIQDIKVVDTLPTDNVLLVQMTSDVVRLVRGMGIQNVQWMTEGNMVHKYKVMTIQVPQIRSDQNKKSGIVHMA
jgi:hypothetical protein